MREYLNHIRFARLLAALAAYVFLSAQVQAQDVLTHPDIDPRLIEIVERVKSQAINSDATELRGIQTKSEHTLTAEKRIIKAGQILEATYSLDPEKIRAAITEFKSIDKADNTPSLKRVVKLYSDYADLLEADVSSDIFENLISTYENKGNWLEIYFTQRLSIQLLIDSSERQAALQKAQSTFALIPDGEDQNHYIKYAKANITSTIAQLHNMQGNLDLAIISSLDYLRLTKTAPNSQASIDLINNLIYAHALGRDQKTLIYLGEQLLEIEKTESSSILGLSEFRIGQAMNSNGRFQEGLKYSKIAQDKTDHPIILRQANVAEAIALAGLGRKAEAYRKARDAKVNLSPKHLLNLEKRRDDLYLAFLLAQGEDNLLAMQLYNRQLDVTAQKFLANNSRDTTAMLASLENTKERQAEREAAAKREAELQALTIDRQRKVNRMLMILTLLMAIAAMTAVIFAKYRGEMLKKLEIKTREAASAEKLKTEFLGMISHELRTPLNGIIGISDFLHNYHQDADIRKKTGIILRSGNELLAVVKSLTDMARIDAGQLTLNPENTDLAKSLSNISESWVEKARTESPTFTYHIDPVIGSHHVDAERLRQCINVLLSNAFSFTDTGRVHLHITANTNPSGYVTGLTAIMADTGRGMTELVQSRLFKPFMQADTTLRRNHMGTGLSLAIARALARMMDGDITVVSREGRGSEFTLTASLKPVQLDHAEPAISDYDAKQPAIAPPIAIDNAVTDGVEEKADMAIDLAPVSAVQPVLDTNESVSADLILSELIPEKIEGPQPVKQPTENVAAPILETPILDSGAAPSSKFVDLMKAKPGQPRLHDVPERGSPEPISDRLRILVVDDMQANRDILRFMLEAKGHDPDEANDGNEALIALTKRDYDLMILDVHMSGLDGIQTLHQLRGSDNRNSEVMVVALTADNASSTNAACMEAGADLFLTKPVRQADLDKALDYLREPTSERIVRA